jgi:cytochrome c peroxidase
MIPPKSRVGYRRVALGLLAAIGMSQAASAAERKGAPLLPKYQQECGACHVAYPPGMLPAASWQRIMANLQRHYGTDASLDPATLKELSAWLDANSGTFKRVREEPPDARITRSAWFVRKHGEVPAATWKLAAVKSAANCAACHAGAEQGDFNEHNVRIPR